MIIVNPSAGMEKADLFKKEVENLLINQGYQIVMRVTEKKNDAKKFASEASDKSMDLISVLGGDGTVNEVINGIANKINRPSLHIIPLGTVNNFAKALDIPLKPEEAINVLENPTNKKADIGKINGYYFMNLVNLGTIAEATYQVTSEQKSKIGSLAYFMEGLKKFAEKETFSVTIEDENGREQLEAMLVLVTVTDTVAGLQHVLKEANIDDGYLHIFVIKELSGLESVSMLTNLWNHMLKEQDQIEYWKVKSAKIETNPQKVVNIDGDKGFTTPFKLSILEKHITVISEKQDTEN